MEYKFNKQQILRLGETKKKSGNMQLSNNDLLLRTERRLKERVETIISEGVNNKRQ